MIASGFASAAPVIEAGRSIDWSKDADGVDYQNDLPWLARAGWAFTDFDLLFEYATFDRAQSDSSSSMTTTEREASLMARKTFYGPYYLKPYAAISMGALQDTLSSSVMGTSEGATGQATWLASATIGTILPISQGFVAEIEARVSTSPGFAPNPQPSAAGLLGYRF